MNYAMIVLGIASMFCVGAAMAAIGYGFGYRRADKFTVRWERDAEIEALREALELEKLQGQSVVESLVGECNALRAEYAMIVTRIAVGRVKL